MISRRSRVTSLVVVCFGIAIAIPYAWASLRAESQRAPEPTTSELAENARIALTKLMARISIENGAGTTEDEGRVNQSRRSAGDAMTSVLKDWKKQLVKAAGAPIRSGMDNKQQISLRILCEMSPDSDEIEMLVTNVATFSEHPIQISDNPWREYPYCLALWEREATTALLGHYRNKPSNKVTELEVKLVAGIIEMRLGDKHWRRANLAEPFLKYELTRDRSGNVERIQKQWEKIAQGDTGAPTPADRPARD